MTDPTPERALVHRLRLADYHNPLHDDAADLIESLASRVTELEGDLQEAKMLAADRATHLATFVSEQRAAEDEASRIWPEDYNMGRWDGIMINQEQSFAAQRRAFMMGAKWEIAALDAARAESRAYAEKIAEISRYAAWPNEAECYGMKRVRRILDAPLVPADENGERDD